MMRGSRITNCNLRFPALPKLHADERRNVICLTRIRRDPEARGCLMRWRDLIAALEGRRGCCAVRAATAMAVPRPAAARYPSNLWNAFSRLHERRVDCDQQAIWIAGRTSC